MREKSCNGKLFLTALETVDLDLNSAITYALIASACGFGIFVVVNVADANVYRSVALRNLYCFDLCPFDRLPTIQLVEATSSCANSRIAACLTLRSDHANFEIRI